MSQETISIAGLDKAQVLAALYNASRPQGMGFLQYDPTPMAEEEAATLLETHKHFDYLKGRVMKISLDSDNLDPWGYDRDNGEGTAARAIASVRDGAVNSADIQEAHATGKHAAAESARRQMATDPPMTIEVDGGVATANLGLSDVVDVLKPAIDKAVG